jgi:prepilin-type N-terminal cleavage/methylation domain-containing protein
MPTWPQLRCGPATRAAQGQVGLFTLVEILAVVAIIGLVAGLRLPKIRTVVEVRILDKPDNHTAEEFGQIRQHPTIGARILAPIGTFRQALPLVPHHHELLDGSGHPHGLAEIRSR